MKQTINFAGFRDAFRAYDRLDNFSYEGAQALFDYLEEADEDMELDVIALCCEYSEDTWDQITTNYSFDIDSLEDLDESQKIKVVREYLERNTQLIAETPSGFLYANF